MQRDSEIGSLHFDTAARRSARVASRRMRSLVQEAPDHPAKALAAKLRRSFAQLVATTGAARNGMSPDPATQAAANRYVASSTAYLQQLARSCPPAPSAATLRSAPTRYQEQQGHHGVNTFSNYHNASGLGPRIDPGTRVEVTCKVYDPYIESANPDGYWYRIASAPWNDGYYSPANTFMNGDSWDGPYTHNTDFAVPDCDKLPAAAAPSATVAQGPPAPSGYRYSIVLDAFEPNSTVTVDCRDSANPNGFYSFPLTTDSSGHASTSNQCYSADGPDHWVIAGSSVESNHAHWTGGAPAVSTPAGSGAAGNGAGSTGSGSTGGSTGSSDGAPGQPGGQGDAPSTTSAPTASLPAEQCASYPGLGVANGDVAFALFKHYLLDNGEAVVIDWAYFSSNAEFVAEAKSLKAGQFVQGWAPVSGTNLYNALGHFTIARDSADCFLVYDHYDFDWQLNRKYVVFFPLWATQAIGAREFDVHASGKL